MRSKLVKAEARFAEIEASLADVQVIGNQELFRKLMQEHKSLAPIIEKFREYQAAEKDMADNQALMTDTSAEPELRSLAEEEFFLSRASKDKLWEELKILLLPKDKNDDKNVVMEIRAGAGGEESALFVAVLYRMYHMYADSVRWKFELLNVNETGLGGFKEVTFMVIGEGAYSKLKFESGVHRVQRVPETETQGRIHTSTVTVAVLPEAEDVEIEILPSDLKIETIKSSGAGGQHVNKTESAIRLLHKPTGIVIECQDERSQFKNRDKAMKLLRAKLYDLKETEQNERIASERRSQVGTGDRSERIRTYNYPQGRLTDHRIGYTVYSLENFLNGNIGELLEALMVADTAERLKGEKE